MLDVGDAQAVLERLERIAVGDTTRVAVRVEEPEPDRQLANEIEIPVRQKAGSDSRCGSGHGDVILDSDAVVTEYSRELVDQWSEQLLRSSGYEKSGFAEGFDANRPSPPAALFDLLCLEAQTERPKLVVDLGSGTGLSTRPWAERADEVDRRRGEPGDARAGRSGDCGRERPLRPGVRAGDRPSARTRRTSSPARRRCTGWSPSRRFAEAARILRPGGVFAAYDYDWPPIVHWEIEAAFEEMLRRLRTGRRPDGDTCATRRRGISIGSGRAATSGTPARSSCTRQSEAAPGRIVGMALSLGPLTVMLQNGTTEEELGLAALRDDGRPGARRPRSGHLPRLSRSPRSDVRRALRAARCWLRPSPCGRVQRLVRPRRRPRRRLRGRRPAPTRTQDVAWVVLLRKWEDRMALRGSRATQSPTACGARTASSPSSTSRCGRSNGARSRWTRKWARRSSRAIARATGFSGSACAAVSAWGRALDEAASSSDGSQVRNVAQKEPESRSRSTRRSGSSRRRSSRSSRFRSRAGRLHEPDRAALRPRDEHARLQARGRGAARGALLVEGGLAQGQVRVRRLRGEPSTSPALPTTASG